MNTFLKLQEAKRFVLSLLALTLLSFAARAGGESYEIYLNNKLICKQVNGKFVCGDKGLQLTKANANDNLVITYNHCGKVGTGRTIVAKDEHDRLIKEWKFEDDASIIIPVKEILNLQKSSGVKLYYFSTQYLPKGRMLTSINMAEKETAQNAPGRDWFAAAMFMLVCLRLA